MQTFLVGFILGAASMFCLGAWIVRESNEFNPFK